MKAARTLPNLAPNAAPRAWQRMLSGRRLDLLDPSPLDIEIEDIAHGLARVARWNGFCNPPVPMTGTDRARSIDLDQALFDPGTVFSSPEHLHEHQNKSKAKPIEIIQQTK